MTKATSRTGSVGSEQLALIVRRCREKMGWSQDILAEVTGRNTRTIQRVERGESVNFDTRRALARAFGLDDIDAFNDDPGTELEKLVLGTTKAGLLDEVADLREKCEVNQCPHCSAGLSSRIFAHIDPYERDWDVVDTFECGFETFAGTIRRPCPSDPKFPAFEDYNVVCYWNEGENKWIGDAFPKTDMARLVNLGWVVSKTEEGARRVLEASYLHRAGRMTGDERFRIQVTNL